MNKYMMLVCSMALLTACGKEEKIAPKMPEAPMVKTKTAVMPDVISMKDAKSIYKWNNNCFMTYGPMSHEEILMKLKNDKSVAPEKCSKRLKSHSKFSRCLLTKTEQSFTVENIVANKVPDKGVALKECSLFVAGGHFDYD